MAEVLKKRSFDDVEIKEWLESLDYILQNEGPERAQQILEHLQIEAQKKGVAVPYSATTPYINTISLDQQIPFEGSREIERRIKSINRWNAMAMVVRANREEDGIGGHISSYASAATLYEIGFNHFFRARTGDDPGDQIYFQGHATPGIYARAFLEGRISEQQMHNFRREMREGGGLSSYPHPWLMPDLWEYPTVSMGLGPIMAIYNARFSKYLENRGIVEKTGKVWAFLGDGETDEPETLGAISLAAREKLDNLIFVINCNLQRLDGPVRGNGKIIQELEAIFRGAGWRVIKVIWGSDWDELLARDSQGLLVKRMTEVTDGEYQKYTVESGAYIRQHFFGKYPQLLDMVAHLSDEALQKLKRGGHDPVKVYAAYAEAVRAKGQPTVILAKTIKGYGLGEAGEGRNITHQQKKLNEQELREFRSRFGIPLSNEEVAQAPFYRPDENSEEMRYLKARREALGGYIPKREVHAPKLELPTEELYEEFYSGTDNRPVSTTMAFVRILAKLCRNKEIGKLVVPIVPDEARTFGMEALFRQLGIYSSVGQLYEPVDRDSLLYYREAKDGQILEEGITEAGAMSSFIAAGTAPAAYGVNTIPFFIYYSMFGFQRIGDLIWAAGDMRTRGFLLGGTAGRTTLAGEGLQHQDGHSHLLAFPLPNLLAYDPAFAYEIAVIIQEGLKRMYADGDSVFYYLTLYNENYPQAQMPQGESVREGIIKGMYLFAPAKKEMPLKVTLLGSGPILNEVIAAQAMLEEEGIAADVFSVTSYKSLRQDGMACERWNMLHANEPLQTPYVTTCLKDAAPVVVAASDYVKELPDSLAKWIPSHLISLGTNGFGRSESRHALRDFFEVDRRHIAFAAFYGLYEKGFISKDVLVKARDTYRIDPDKKNPMIS
jgi:pyruvate dehydrogenase E1 component